MVALVGQQKRFSLGAAYSRIDPPILFSDVSEFVQTCMHPAQARQLIDRACKVVLSNRTVATITGYSTLRLAQHVDTQNVVPEQT